MSKNKKNEKKVYKMRNQLIGGLIRICDMSVDTYIPEAEWNEIVRSKDNLPTAPTESDHTYKFIPYCDSINNNRINLDHRYCDYISSFAKSQISNIMYIRNTCEALLPVVNWLLKNDDSVILYSQINLVIILNEQLKDFDIIASNVLCTGELLKLTENEEASTAYYIDTINICISIIKQLQLRIRTDISDINIKSMNELRESLFAAIAPSTLFM